MPPFSTVVGEALRCRRSGLLVLCGFLTLLPLSVGCRREEDATRADRLDQATATFDIYWPPKDPEGSLAASFEPLLTATLELDATQQAEDGDEVRLAVTITRPSTEDDRRRWNSTLAFADIEWMGEVRVWDADKKWLWPNLPYLLRLPGKQRIERYGGLDPGKHVDNDFAAVLIRRYDAEGRVESSETKDSPLVSAEWHAVDAAADIDLHSIVHTAKSDEFVLHLSEEGENASGRLKVWLIYADFLGATAPRTWPRDREWAGGILAYYEADWQRTPDGGCRVVVHAKRPEQSTRFDWAGWVVREPGSKESQAEMRLSNRAEPTER